jgi:hypothetical protein
MSLERVLARVDWASRRDAYGSAEALPDLLRAIPRGDGSPPEDMLDQVYGRICHQDVVEEIAPAVAPALVALLELPSPVPRWKVLDVLTAVLGRADVAPPVLGEVPRRYGFAGRRRRDPEAANRYVARSRRFQAAFDAGVERYVDLLEDHDPRTRAHAARAVALARTDGSATLDRLQAAAGREEQPEVRAATSLAVAVFVARNGASKVELPPLPGGAPPFLEASHAAARALLAHRAPREELLEGLEAGFDHSRRDLEFFPWCEGSLPGFCAEVARRCARWDREGALAVLVRGLERVERWYRPPELYWEWSEPQLVGENLARLAFARFRGREHDVLPEELAASEGWILRTLLATGREIPGLAHCGFRFGGDVERFLEGGGPLDRRVKGRWRGEVVAWPVWKWLHLLQDARVRGGGQAAGEDPEVLRSMLRSALSPAETLAWAVDAASGSYGLASERGLVREMADLVAAAAPRMREELLREVRALDRPPPPAALPLLVLPLLESGDLRSGELRDRLAGLVRAFPPSRWRREAAALLDQSA